MKALVIGAAGFVGKHLMRHLRKDCGWAVAATKLPHEQIDGLDEFAKLGVDIFDLDILNQDDVSCLLKKNQPDCIFHLAAQSSVSLSWENPALTVDVNIKGTVNVLEALRQLGKKPKVLLVGSGEEYGRVNQDEVPICEDNALRPGNVYAATKACQGILGKIYADAYNLDIIIVRAFNHIGPGQSPVFVVSDFCKQVAEIEAGQREPVIRVGNLSAKRDFTDVRDVVRAYGLLIEYGKRGETYNVGSGKAIDIDSILKAILAKSSADIEVVTDKSKLRPIDVPIIEADIGKLRMLTNWKPEIELEQTIAETLEHWKRNIRRSQ
ncbi:MAG: GDP-mannose 4,6-dehydratase [Oscillospiraceae bacterium]|nr:GDP-mannose 4,6-dehydratase [Oscillospiraceae bacterium]